MGKYKMYLKRLELQGFKSFSDKTCLEFKPGITVVIGPNGSGKSNISDAIRWVLGEQSMKALRGQNSSDVIFSGTQNRKSLGFAEVSIVIDNQDGRLPIEYGEVTVTRKIYRSGETGYFINKVPCRLKDILELFMDTGIGKDGYSIIGQGRIDEILSNKSEDRRKIFEEAAGIVKFRVRKIESEKKLEQTKLNLLRINDILAEIEANIEPLKMQSEKAKKFLSLKEDLKNIEVGLFLENIEQYKKKLEQIVQDDAIMQNQYQEEEIKKEHMTQIKEALKNEINELTWKIEEIQNEKNNSASKTEKMNSEIEIAKQRIENNQQNALRFTEEIQELQGKIQELKEEEEQKNVKKENLQKNREKFEKELQIKEEEFTKLNAQLSEEELAIENKKKQVEENTDKKYEMASQMNMQDANFENLIQRKKTISQEIKQTISELDASYMGKNEMIDSFTQIEEQRNEWMQKAKEKQEQMANDEQRIKEYREQIASMQYNKQMASSKYQFLQETEKEKEGYVKSVKNLLLACEKDKELNHGVHGVLANLITVDKKYETAIEICLGSNLQNIVTQTEQEAKKLIDYLRQNNLGRASFLPISTIQPNQLSSIKQVEGVIGIASEVVTCKNEYRNIVENLLGKTVLVENIDVAIQLAKQNQYRFRIVTLKGDVINPSGAMSGGSTPSKTVNILGRGRQLEELHKQIEELTKQIKQKEEETNKIETAIQTVKEEKEEAEKNLQEIEIVYATEKQKKVNIEENIEKLQEKLTKLREEEKNIEEKKKENREEKQQKEQEMANINEQMEKMQKEIEQFASQNKDKQKMLDDLHFDITNLKISVSSFDESNGSIEEMLARIKQDKENAYKSIENKKRETRKLTSRKYSTTRKNSNFTKYNSRNERKTFTK